MPCRITKDGWKAIEAEEEAKRAEGGLHDSSVRHATEYGAENRCSRRIKNMGDIYTRSASAGGGGEHVALVYALGLFIECLDAKGIVSFEDYRAKLMALWDQIPADDPSGVGGVFGKLSEIITDAIDRRPPR